MEINKKLKNKRKELGLTMLEVANKVGVSEATVSRWESGDIANMRRDKIVLLANALSVTPAYIMGYEEMDTNNKYPSPEITEDYVTFPVIGEIAAGYDHVAIEDWQGEKIDIPTSYLKGRAKDDFFVLSVTGNSMYPMYQDGDKVLVLKQSTLNYSGDIGVVLYDGENATLKKVEYVPGEDWMKLIPINPNVPPIKIEGAELETCRILGIPKLLIREVT